MLRNHFRKKSYQTRKKMLKVFNDTIVIDDNHTQVVSSSFFSPEEPRKKCKLETRMTLGPDFLENKFYRSLKFSCHEKLIQKRWAIFQNFYSWIINKIKKTYVTWQFGNIGVYQIKNWIFATLLTFFCLSFSHESKIWGNEIISFPENPDLGCAHLVLPVWHFSVVPPPPVTGRVHSWWRLTWRDDVGEVLKIKLAIFFYFNGLLILRR